MSEAAMSEVAVIPHRNASPSTSQSMSQSPSQSAPTSTGRILIIDDEAEIRESLETLLQLEGYTVVVAGTGLEGLARSVERRAERGAGGRSQAGCGSGSRNGGGIRPRLW